MERLFILEDELTSRMILETTLSHYEIVFAEDIESAKRILSTEKFDIYLLDLNLPDGQSTILLEENFISPEEYVFFISSNDDLHNQLLSFQLGADDYISKPFHPLILKAKLESRLKTISNSKEVEQVQHGLLTLDDTTKTIHCADLDLSDAKLTKTEFTLLKYFLMNKNLVLSRSQIIDNISEGCSNVTERSVDAHVSKLRKKLSSFNKTISSVHGFGYKLEEDSFSELIPTLL